jgi:hypothetical protein
MTQIQLPLTFREWKLQHLDLVEKFSEEEGVCPDCLGEKTVEINGVFDYCNRCMGIGCVFTEKKLCELYEADQGLQILERLYQLTKQKAVNKIIWKTSGGQGRILHLIDSTGLARCGRQFDPQRTQEPKVTPDSPTMPYCQRCMIADMALQNEAQHQ